MNALKITRLILVRSSINLSRQARASNVADEIRKPVALRSRKPKGPSSTPQIFVDLKSVTAHAGSGGHGCASFLQLWANDMAGPDGGDGGNGGHVVFQAHSDTKDLNNVKPFLKAQNGEKGRNKDCFGKCAQHLFVKVPIGTVVKDEFGNVVGDLHKENMMFIAARGGAGGHGNKFFVTAINQSPQVAELGAEGEEKRYILEMKCVADIGLVGMPNAGKSTLLRAISRARPKVASYAFTTLVPHIGIVQYDDYEQVAVADLPGLIKDSYLNEGLGIQFLKHTERCSGLLYVIDLSVRDPWTQLEILQFELSQFSEELPKRPHAIVGNKMDLPEAQENLKLLEAKVNLPVIAISGKTGKNISALLDHIRKLYDEKQKTS